MNNQHTPLPNKWIIWLYRVHLATRHKWLMTAHWCISLTQICDLSFLHWYLGWKSLHCIVPDESLQYKQGKSEWCDSCDRPSNVTQVGFKSSIFRRVWPSNLMDDLTNNRAPVLCYVTLSALFQNHQWIQTAVTVRKRPTRVKINNFFWTSWHQNLTDDLEKQQGTSSMPLKVLCVISQPCVNSTGATVRKRPNWGKICFYRCYFDLWPLTFTFRTEITFVNGHNSWIFDDDTMRVTLGKVS